MHDQHGRTVGKRSRWTLLAWTGGMKWGMGRFCWQLFDRNGEPEGETGHADGVPSWSLVATSANADGGFTVVYRSKPSLAIESVALCPLFI